MAKEKDPRGTKLERTGTDTFRVHMEDGSIAEGKVDPNKVRFAEDSRKGPGGKLLIVGGVGKKKYNVMTNKSRRELGIPEDPNLTE